MVPTNEHLAVKFSPDLDVKLEKKLHMKAAIAHGSRCGGLVKSEPLLELCSERRLNNSRSG